jgi:three-Cys-motif partner protein
MVAPEVAQPGDNAATDRLQPGGPTGGDAGSRAVGEETGPVNQFFVSKQAAAILKHGILSRYLPPFIGKVGSRSLGNRVVLLDGYAGPGRYEDGTPGSPALLADTARQARVSTRSVECHLVEENKKHYGRLVNFLKAEGSELRATAYQGRVEEHLDSVLQKAVGLPMFAYLDPFGFGVPLDEVVRLLNRCGSPGAAQPTEVLLNFTATGIRRVGGLLRERDITNASKKTLLRCDQACGGTWWQDVFRSENGEDPVHAVASRYLSQVCARTGTRGFLLPVKNRKNHKPIYYLIFFTRHGDGIWLFNEAVSGASADWRHVQAPPLQQPNADLLFDMPQPSFEDEEERRASDWVRIIQGNVQRLLQAGAFVVGEKSAEVYGSTLGEARETHVRRAIKNLYESGLTGTSGVGKIPLMAIKPPEP